MSALLIFLRSNPILAALGVAFIAASSIAAFQTHQVGELQKEVGALATDLLTCGSVNQSNLEEYNRVLGLLHENAERRQAIIERQARQIAQLNAVEAEQNEEASDDIETIETAANACADQPLPDAIRLLYAASNH